MKRSCGVRPCTLDSVSGVCCMHTAVVFYMLYPSGQSPAEAPLPALGSVRLLPWMCWVLTRCVWSACEMRSVTNFFGTEAHQHSGQEMLVRYLCLFSGEGVCCEWIEASVTEKGIPTSLWGCGCLYMQVRPSLCTVLLSAAGYVFMLRCGWKKWHLPSTLLLEKHLCESCLSGTCSEKIK